MKDQASSVEYAHLVREFQTLVGGRIDKVYADDKYVLLSVYAKKRVNLVVDVPSVAYLTTSKPAFSPPKGFSMFLRKRLQKGIIRGITQLGMDRILRLDIEKEQIYHVYFELFGKGNIVVCDENDKVISAREYVTFADRAIRGGQVYAPPAPQPDIRTMSEESFAKIVTGKPVVIALASDIGLGGEYAQLVCKRAGIDDQSTDADASKLFPEVQRLFTESAPEHTADSAYPVQVVDGAAKTETFSEAIAAIRDGLRESAQKTERVAARTQRKDKVARILASQEKQAAGFLKAAEENQRKGELLYERYQEVDSILKEAAKDRKSLSKEDFEKKWSAHPLVAKADTEDFTLEI